MYKALGVFKSLHSLKWYIALVGNIYETNTKYVIDKLETLRIEKKDIEVDIEQL